MVNEGRSRLGSRHRGGFSFIIAFDECAFFTHFNLDGSCFACGIGLFDFAGGFFHQRDLFTLAGDSAVTGLQIAQKLLLVVFSQRVGGR